MQKLFTLLLLTVSINFGYSQTFQEITTGPGYQRQGYYKLGSETEKTVFNTSWDIAFSVFGQQDAAVFINESSGSRMGMATSAIEVYYTDGDFASTPNPATLTDKRLYNPETSWNYGALNEIRKPGQFFDYGWGAYQPSANKVVGTVVYVLKLRDGKYKKLMIESLTAAGYNFKYADLDGSNEVTKVINKGDHTGKVCAYFSFTTNATVDVEPADGFDFVYKRYFSPLRDTLSGLFIQYSLTGIQMGLGVKTAKVTGINPTTVKYQDYNTQLSSSTDVIGHDWKRFTGSKWALPQDEVYFVKTKESRVWKIRFIDFEGSATGTAVLEKTDLGLFTAVKNLSKTQVAIYPNPTTDKVYLSLDTKDFVGKNLTVNVIDMSGKVVINQNIKLTEEFEVFEIYTQSLAKGIYLLQLADEKQTFVAQKISKI